MDCAKIKELLSGYIDDALDQETTSLIDEHLKGCQECYNELASFRTYIKDIEPLKDAKAPEGFLGSVHQRIENASGMNKIFKKIFIPFHIKVPIEALAIAASVMLLVTVYKGIGNRPLTEIAQIPVETQKKLETDEITKERRGDKFIPIEGLGAGKELVDQGITLDLERQRAVNIVAQEKSSLGYDLEKRQEPTSDTLAEVAAPKAVAESTYRARNEEPATESLFDAPAGAILLKEESASLRKIEDIVKDLQGTVIGIKENQETGIIEFVTVSIPQNKYELLLKNLGNIGEVKAGLIDESDSEDTQLVVIIKVTA